MKTSLRLFFAALLTSSAFLSLGTQSGSAMFLPRGFQSEGSASKPSSGKVAPTAQEVADAKAKNLVWVNTGTRVYHKSTSPLYGTTERGKFMTEDDARKAGYRLGDESRGQRASRSKGSAK